MLSKDEVLKMARQAGFMLVTDSQEGQSAWYECFTEEIEAFAKLVADVATAKEREEIARYIEPDEDHRRDASWGYLGGKEGVELLDGLVKKIRARGEA